MVLALLPALSRARTICPNPPIDGLHDVAVGIVGSTCRKRYSDACSSTLVLPAIHNNDKPPRIPASTIRKQRNARDHWNFYLGISNRLR